MAYNFIGPTLQEAQIYQDSLAQGNVNPPPGGTWVNPDTYAMPSGAITGGRDWNKNATYAQAPNTSNNSSNNDSGPSREELEYRREMENLRGTYSDMLNDQLNYLGSQRTAQEGTVTSQYNRGVNALGLQKTQGLQSLEKNRAAAEQNQARNLRDISSNIKNAFMAGNVYLGSRGAGDSSAANQYSYALNKMGTRQRSDVMQNTANIMSDIDARKTDLDNTYSTAMNDLMEQRNVALNDIASWFATQQAQARSSKGQNMAELSKTALEMAINKVNQINQYVVNKKQALDQWAMGVSSNIGQLERTMQQTAEFTPNLPQASRSIFGNVSMPTQDSRAYYSSGDTEEDNFRGLFG